MRLRIRLHNQRETSIPINHQDLLTGAVYRLLESSDADYSRFLHDQGYGADGDDRRRFKLFVFSWLQPRGRVQVVGQELRLPPGEVTWLLASPIQEFLLHAATALLGSGVLRVGSATFPITAVETLPAPDVSPGRMRGACLTPIVASVPRPAEESRYPRYLRPADGEEFSEAVHRNLARKHQALFGSEPQGESFRIHFDPDYLEQHRGGTKLIEYKGIRIVGARAPFTATASPILLQVGYECGLGEKNAGGFGMVEVRG